MVGAFEEILDVLDMSDMGRWRAGGIGTPWVRGDGERTAGISRETSELIVFERRVAKVEAEAVRSASCKSLEDLEGDQLCTSSDLDLA